MNALRWSVFLLLLSAPPTLVHGQDDPWQQWNDPTLDDTVRLNAMSAVMRSLPYDMDTLLILADMQEMLAMKPGLEKWRIRALQRQAEALAHSGRIEEAMTRYDTVIGLQRRSADIRGVSNGLRDIGSLLYKAGYFDRAMEKFLEAMRIREELGDRIGVAGIMTSIGLLHMDHGDAQGALAYYEKSMAVYIAEQDSVRLAVLLNTIGTPLRALGRCEEAIPDHLRSMAIHQRFGRKKGVAASLNHLAAAYNCLHKPNEALEYSTQSLRIRESIGDTAGVAYALLQQAKAHLQLQDYSAAVRCAEKALRIGTKMVQIPIRKEASALLYEAYKGGGEWQKAVEMGELALRIKDSLSGDDAKRAILRREYEYDYAKQAMADSLEMVRLANEERCAFDGQMQREEERREFLLACGAAALVVFLVIAYLLVQRLRQMRRLAAQEKRLHATQVDNLMHEKEIGAINAMLEGQEKERDRLAKDLHDRLGGMLSAIKHQLGAVEEDVHQVRSEQGAHYTKVHGMLDAAVGEVRRISHDMITVTLSRFGLAKALDDLCDTVRVTGRMDVEVRTFGLEHRMERSREIAVYRIVQEAISNVLKHAQASELSVDVTRGPGRLSVIVHDNGKGFDTAAQASGIGLENMRQRAAGIGATLRLESTPGKGTTVSVEGPVVE